MNQKILDLLQSALLQSAADGNQAAFSNIRKLLDNPRRLQMLSRKANNDPGKFLKMLKVKSGK